MLINMILDFMFYKTVKIRSKSTGIIYYGVKK